ncbi:cupin domain-containing protein [Flavisericum labens]|uniref:cupin domain-containing protein n=1 Tax=Flavisericum labens TaxID=3377112 RepID=UPI00387B7834
MKLKTVRTLIFLAVFIFTGCSNEKKNQNIDAKEDVIQSLKIENLLRDSLELEEGIEVIMSYIELPKNTTLPTHYHPGEEFVYLIQGSGELTLKDKSKIIIKAGETAKVPLRHVHSFSSLNEDVKGVVFRVHEKGQPDRILVE